MTWLTWRLQRTELVFLGILFLGLGGVLLQSHADVVARSKIYTAETCPVPLGGSGTEQGCSIPLGRVYQLVMQGLPWFNFLPLLAALLLALPIVLELENGTYRLAWTQGVTRGRWVRTKLGIVSLCGMVFAALFTLTFHWWSSPRDPLNGRLGQDYYDLRGTLPVGYTLFAIGLMLAVGTVLRRPVPAIVLAAAAYSAVTIPFGLWIRPRLISPVTQSSEAYHDTNPRFPWIVSSGWQDSAGNQMSSRQFVEFCDLTSAGSGARSTQEQCVAEHGLVHFQSYHPASHYWPLQLVETGLFLAVGVALIGFAAWYMLRRIE